MRWDTRKTQMSVARLLSSCCRRSASSSPSTLASASQYSTRNCISFSVYASNWVACVCLFKYFKLNYAGTIKSTDWLILSDNHFLSINFWHFAFVFIHASRVTMKMKISVRRVVVSFQSISSLTFTIFCYILCASVSRPWKNAENCKTISFYICFDGGTRRAREKKTAKFIGC